MTQTIVYSDIDLVTGVGSITIKTSDNGIDTYHTKDVNLDVSDKNSIITILKGYIN
jgi:hypothetical protein